MSGLRERIRAAWQGRISGCQLGKPVELLSMTQGHAALTAYLERTGALPLRTYVPLIEGTIVEQVGRASCRGILTRSEPDDDINYTVLALLLLEEHGLAMRTSDVARLWLNRLPAAATFTAERAAYRTLLERAHDWFAFGAEPGFDLAECASSEYNEWIGAQIRADLYGWVCPGRPALAADLAPRSVVCGVCKANPFRSRGQRRGVGASPSPSPAWTSCGSRTWRIARTPSPSASRESREAGAPRERRTDLRPMSRSARRSAGEWNSPATIGKVL